VRIRQCCKFPHSGPFD